VIHPRIETKIYHPKPRANLILRERLNEALNFGIQNHHRLMLIAAPAGFGKTTQVVNWLPVQDGNHFAAWLSLDEDDNDPARFVDYLLAAIDQVIPGFGEDLQPLLSTPQGLPIKTLSALIINTLVRIKAPVILVLDDYHLITNEQVHELIRSLIENSPGNFQIVVTTRIDPPFPLARWRAKGWITEMYEADLRFTDEETLAFLTQTMRLTISSEHSHALTNRTEGWITGLQLAALSLRTRENVEVFVQEFSGSHRFVLDYLIEEVLAGIPAKQQQFLLRTAFLDHFCGELCDCLMEDTDSQNILESLQKRNLFLIPMDENRHWYRYHHLFADVLKIQAGNLIPEYQEADTRKAAYWFAEQGDYLSAVKYALEIEEFQIFREAISRTGEDLVKRGHLFTLLKWYEKIPEVELRQDARLALDKAWALFLSGQTQMTVPVLEIAREALPKENAGQLIGEIESIESFLAATTGNYAKALKSAEKALSLLGEANDVIRAATLLSLGIIYTQAAKTTAAEKTLQEAVRLSDATDNLLAYASAAGELALIHNVRGNNQEGLIVCQQAIDRLQDRFGMPLPIAALNFLIHSLLLYENNQLDAAEAAFEKSSELAVNAEMRGYAITIELLRAFLTAARGNPAEAIKIIQRSRHQLPTTEDAGDLPLLATVEAHFLMQLDAIDLVKEWADQVDWNPSPSGGFFGDLAWYSRIRLAIAQNRYSEAHHWIATLKQNAEAHHLQRRLIVLGVLETIVLSVEGTQEAACAALSSAVVLAAPGGYVQIFVENLPRIEPLLRQVREAAPEFVDRILSAGKPKGMKHEPTPPKLIEPLSQRETEVLKLLAAGLTSPEIADQLTISSGTVRTHIKSIYRKLDVHKRLEAVKRAEDLGVV
jgi:LuxR family maltose regulon positive regulatory protein